MGERKWVRNPIEWGPHWFCKSLADRDLAEYRYVSRHETSFVWFTYYERDGGEKVITVDMGWWLLILDERKTAFVEERLILR